MPVQTVALACCLLSSMAGLGYAQRTGQVDCLPGTLNVVLAAPHGGTAEPIEIPDRDAGCWQDGRCVYRHDCGTKDFIQCSVTTVRDTNTLELTELLRAELHALTGRYPAAVINRLHRRKLDANRDRDEAAFGEPVPAQAWDEFHRCIDQAKARIQGNGLFLDIHGHGHTIQRAELGYLLSGRDLDNDNLSPERSSIKALASRRQDLLRGSASFGAYMEAEGRRAVPGPEDPGPGGEAYFSGGYNTRRHGSRDQGEIDAIQIESPRTYRLDPEGYARDLARAVQAYLAENYRGNQ